MRRSHALPPAVALALPATLLGPRWTRLPARASLGLYAGAAIATSVTQARRATPGDVAALPIVFATMHVAWGLGFLAGCLRFGLPTEALARILPGRRAR
jgi:hypothetical protein